MLVLSSIGIVRLSPRPRLFTVLPRHAGLVRRSRRRWVGAIRVPAREGRVGSGRRGVVGVGVVALAVGVSSGGGVAALRVGERRGAIL